MESNILYGVEISSGEIGEISVFDIVEEKPKIYKIVGRDEFSHWERTIKKSEMTCGSLYRKKFVKSYPEALQLAKEVIQRVIETNNNKIAWLKKENARLAEKLNGTEVKQ